MRPWRDGHGRIGGAILLSEFVTEQVEIKHALYESEARFRVTFENAPVGIAHLSPGYKWLRVNDAFCSIHGYPAHELTTKSLSDIVPPDDFAYLYARGEEMRDEKIDRFQTDRHVVRKDGTIGWVRVAVACLRKINGSIDYFVVVVEDISARKQAEEQVRLLMREAKHRVKNVLGLVQAIARQTVAGSVNEYIAQFIERIQALAANQDLLGRRDKGRGTDLEDLVRAQLAHFADLVDTRITVRGPKLSLKATAAQAVGLALHELATNASKYGALSTDAGRVVVGWEFDGDSITMSWTEHGGPPVLPPDHRGFGTRVIDSMMQRAVGGEVKLNYASSGLEWHLTCPAANALEG
jgi:PAS domain S-box-containing protein